MATYLPSSGAISINDINTLFGRGANLGAYRGTTYYTSSAGPFTFSAGAISMNNFYGTGPTANRVAISYTFSASTANASLNVAAIGGYSAGKSDITITVNSGVILYGSGGVGLTLTGGTSGDTITLVNNGYIVGAGGGNGSVNVAGSPGTNALSLGFATTVNNQSGFIGGGGGSGGSKSTIAGAGAGGNSTSGVGGNGTTSNASAYSPWISTGGGGGWGGAGGACYQGSSNNSGAPSIAAGGGRGANGADGSGSSAKVLQYAGGAAGKAVALNGNTITWVGGSASSSRAYGSVS